jgi:phenylpropionate dioxygenase-like ring-hydroxylating dioxygenase large terminal subunit
MPVPIRSGAPLPMPFGWFAVAYSDDLDVGEVRPLFLFDEHLVLFRTGDGDAHVAAAFCPHLGAHLGHGGKVEGDAIVCPFHGWRFDGGGRCVGVPYAKAIPRRARHGACLYSYPVCERNRLVWAWHHPRHAPPTFELDDVAEFAEPSRGELRRYEWEVDVALQEAGENAVDVAHFCTVHGAAAMPTASIALDGHRRVTRLTMLAPVIDEAGNVDLTRTATVEFVTTSCGPGMTWQSFSLGAMVTMLATSTPITATRMHLRFAFARPADQPPRKAMLTDALIAEVVRQVEQDIPIWEHKTHWASPMLCAGDGPIAKYRRWFSQFYDQSPEPRSASGGAP